MSIEERKAYELVNMYYNHSRNQEEAIERAEGVLLGTLCEKIDSLHSHVFVRKDFDQPLIESSIKQLKMWQEVGYHIQQIKRKLPIT